MTHLKGEKTQTNSISMKDAVFVIIEAESLKQHKDSIQEIGNDSKISLEQI